ncbi:MAG: serine/threonine protein kinase [Atopobiaceae bacterium]|jgi:serine/threonine-protein kinase|nr:serine/threonine protein kinase [Atopobiaceae bacterium]
MGADGDAYDDVSDPVPDPLLLGRYRVIERKGTGGFGQVLVCWDTRLQRRVAIKCLPLTPAAGAAATSSVDEALGEARTACLLAHPNIVTVFDFEADDRMAYLVMEYVDGITLAEFLARVEGGTLTHDECAHVLSSLADALTFAHDNGVLHLDIKPANVFIDRSGAVKLGDFGMATLASAAGFGGARGGTVGYMPPEQLDGALVDERCDVFSLAVVCYESLVGRGPFSAGTADASEKAIWHGARPLSSIDHDVDPEVSDALARALEADASYRTTSVADLADAVCPLLGDRSAGRASIATLLGQVTDDETESDEWRDFAHAPLSERAPWLPGLLLRLTTAAACGWLGALLAPGVAAATGMPLLALAAILALAGALVPALGCALVLVELVVAIALAGGDSSTTLLCLGLGVACLAWWFLVGRRDRPASLALLAPAAIGMPELSAPLSGYALGPVEAATTGAFGWLLQHVVLAATSSSFSAGSVADAVTSGLSHPTWWVVACASGVAACVASVLARRESRGLAITGQILAAGIVIAGYVIASRVENGGIWVSPSWVPLGLAVLFSLLVVVVMVALGLPPARLEDD